LILEGYAYAAAALAQAILHKNAAAHGVSIRFKLDRDFKI
jgi:hypothetical protein